jgi:hypothetical protein
MLMPTTGCRVTVVPTATPNICAFAPQSFNRQPRRAEAEHVGLRVLGARGSELEREFADGMVRQLFEPILAAASEAMRDELLAGAAGQAAVLFERIDAAAGAPGGDVSFTTLHGLFWLTATYARKILWCWSWTICTGLTPLRCASDLVGFKNPVTVADLGDASG